MRSALAVRQGRPQPDPLAPFGIGAFFAFGDSRRLSVTSKDGKRPDIPVQLMRELVTTGRAATEFIFLQGPKPEEIEALRAMGYRPEAVLDNYAKRVAHKHELADMLAKDPWMRTRLDYIVYARHIAWEHGGQPAIRMAGTSCASEQRTGAAARSASQVAGFCWPAAACRVTRGTRPAPGAGSPWPVP